jgi:hypothetical protein
MNDELESIWKEAMVSMESEVSRVSLNTDESSRCCSRSAVNIRINVNSPLLAWISAHPIQSTGPTFLSTGFVRRHATGTSFVNSVQEVYSDIPDLKIQNDKFIFLLIL